MAADAVREALLRFDRIDRELDMPDPQSLASDQVPAEVGQAHTTSSRSRSLSLNRSSHAPLHPSTSQTPALRQYEIEARGVDGLISEALLFGNRDAEPEVSPGG